MEKKINKRIKFVIVRLNPEIERIIKARITSVAIIEEYAILGAIDTNKTTLKAILKAHIASL
jgi:hypothetical protein